MKFVFVLAFFVSLSLPSLLVSQDYDPQDYDPKKEDWNTPLVYQEGIKEAPDYLPLRSGQEWRSFWVDAWNKGISNSTQVKEVVQTAVNYGYNAIVVQARRRGDAIYFPTYPNTEPRMSGLASDFDALQEMIRQAHTAGLEVHAWITTFLISTATPPTSPEHVFNKHPEYLTQNYAGETKIAEGYYLDPGNPDALAWNSRVVLDLVRNYEIDGIHFDYVRYPQQDAGYNPVAVARFNKEFGLTGKPACNDEKFGAWRRRQITDWLRNMYVKITEVKPWMKITAATFAGRSDAYSNRFQDWAQWASEGIIDANLPMNYSTGASTFQARVDDILQYSYGRHVYMGIGAYLLDVDGTISQLQYCRNKSTTGLILFSYANNNKGGDWLSCYDRIHKELFSSPAVVPEMPWKKAPIGYVRGRVIDRNALAVYNAVISLNNTQKNVKTDGEGCFSLLSIAPGEYSLSCHAQGFYGKEKKITVIAGKVTVCDLEMEAGEPTQYTLDTEIASFKGNWTIGVSAADKFGSNYRFIGRGDGTQKAVFTFPTGISGRYNVYVWYSQGTNRATKACHEIYHDGGVESIFVNQQANGGKWVLLGTWNFTTPQNGSVYISNAFNVGDVVIADAVKLEKA